MTESQPTESQPTESQPTESHAGLFTGVGVALLTLLTGDGDVDTRATGDLAAELVSRGMRGVLACGTTGEPATLTDAERRSVISAVRAAVPPQIPVLAGTGAASAERAARLTAEAVEAGAEAILAWPPPGSEDLAGYFAAVSAAAQGRPVLAYHIPWISAPGVPVKALDGLPVAGIKDSSGDPDRLIEEIAYYRGATYTGSSALLALAGPTGGTGAILAAANVEPELCCAAFAGDGTAQRELAQVHLAGRAGGPPALKGILAERHGVSALSRAS
jgi:4-hydroxy-tetrahydrodipicolinate synthase